APSPAAPAPGALAAQPTGDARPLFPSTFKPTQPAAPIRPSQAADAGAGALTSTAVPLAVVVGVILLAAVVFRRAVHTGGSLASAMGAGGRAPAGLLEVLGRYPVCRGQTLVLLKLDQRVLLLSQTPRTRVHPGGFTTLSEITDPCEVASILTKVSETEGTGPAARFNAILADADGRHEPLSSRRRGLTRLSSMLGGGQPVSWQEPQPPAPTRPEPVETPAPTMRFAPSGVDSLRSRLAAIKSGGGA
ncbi:MAG: flagellar biosynthetic protein FliO, partial [Phycisphaerales bacterium]|nr:flagellar biosynthetic protein FliO [Phycisphaerales bacterium]